MINRDVGIITHLDRVFLELQEKLFPVKMPSKWIVPMIKRMDKIQKELGIKYYMKTHSDLDMFVWGLSLADTYPKEDREA